MRGGLWAGVLPRVKSIPATQIATDSRSKQEHRQMYTCRGMGRGRGVCECMGGITYRRQGNGVQLAGHVCLNVAVFKI